MDFTQNTPKYAQIGSKVANFTPKEAYFKVTLGFQHVC